MTSFTLLVLTGVPQKFHDSGAGEGLVALFGGMEATRALHRVAGVVFAIQAIVHLAVNGARIFMGTMRPHMLVTRRDFTDTLALVRHSLGRPGPAPRFDRYDGRQKFEYWGILVGGAVMITTGFILMYPLVFSTVLPGQLIPAAKMAHSFEAVMALLVIVVWHFYCAILSPEVFPLDRAIFTGRISEERMKEEHPEEWERVRRSAPPGVPEPPGTSTVPPGTATVPPGSPPPPA
jgi:cytochrome b subunit of formate dehydrogenase